jgi:2-polyprenyl-6-methoxyphenol hydroxylase-like FAD-dependent oxidoreductase
VAQQSGGEAAALVVGAGPTGLAMASQLARHGLTCRIVDKAGAPSGNSRAVGIQARTLELFDNMGIVQQVLDNGVIIHGIAIHAERGRVVHLAMDELDSPYPFLLDLPQAGTERILRSYLASFGVQVEWGAELTGFTQDADGVSATLRHADGRDETVRTPWVLGCDGAHSAVRHTVGLPFEGYALPAGFAVGDLKVQWSLPDDEMHEFLHSDGLLAAFPLPGGRQRLAVETEQYNVDGALPQPTLEDFQRWVRERGPADAIVSDPQWLTPFRVSFRHAPHYRQGRAFLAGDAAHIHSPAGGQGMNTCIQDAYNLAWKLALVHKGQAPASLLDSYEAEREPVAAGVLQMTELASRVVQIRSPVGVMLRNRLMPLLAAQEVIQQRMTQRMSELPINYRKSPIVAEHESSMFGRLRLRGGPRPGDRAPDASPLRRADGTALRLFDVLRGTKHTLLLFAGADPSVDSWRRLGELAGAVGDRYGDRVSAVVAVAGDSVPAGSTSAGSMVLDAELALHHRYGADAECLYLVRPDGYVGYRSQPAVGPSLLDYLARIFT